MGIFGFILISSLYLHIHTGFQNLDFVFYITVEPALNSYSKDVGEFKEGENINNELTRWYINTKTNKCETFQYRGTGGNFNNFRTEIECKRHFENPVADKIEGCTDPAEATGSCNTLNDGGLIEERWSWDRNTATCKKFSYSGCGGNKNRYDSQEECEAFCYNDETHYGNPANDVTWDNAKKTKYTIPNYHDCHLKPDLEKDTADIKAVALIEKKQCVYAAAGSKVVGKKIRGAFNSINESFEHDATEKNNTIKMKQKIEACSRVQPDQFSGPTNANDKPEIRFYYDHSNKGCSRFESWPGDLDITKNNFPSAEICESYCGWDKRPEEQAIERKPVCFEPKAGEFSPTDNINGNLNVKRWYFDSSEEAFKCTSFLFGGLNGNGNNFKSEEACQKICWEHMDPDETTFQVKDDYSGTQNDKKQTSNQ